MSDDRDRRRRAMEAEMRRWGVRREELPPIKDEDDTVDYIIKEVGMPWDRGLDQHGSPRSPGRGVDLTGKTEELRLLLREVAEEYQLALDDWQRRTDPEKPLPGMRPRVQPPRTDPVDFGDDVGGGLEDADEYWHEYFYRGRGRPKRSTRGREMPLAPLHPVYYITRHWWLRNVEGVAFRAEVPPADSYDYGSLRPSAKLLVLVLMTLNQNYGPDEASWLYTAWKRRRAKKERRARSRSQESG